MKIGAVAETFDKPSQSRREALVEQILWLIRFRWFAGAGIIVATLMASYVFPVLTVTFHIYICTGLLFACNLLYFRIATKKPSDASRKDIILAMIQVEVDLIIQAQGKFWPMEIKRTSTPSVNHMKPIDRFKKMAGREASKQGFIICNVGEKKNLPGNNVALPWFEFPDRLKRIIA